MNHSMNHSEEFFNDKWFNKFHHTSTVLSLILSLYCSKDLALYIMKSKVTLEYTSIVSITCWFSTFSWCVCIELVSITSKNLLTCWFKKASERTVYLLIVLMAWIYLGCFSILIMNESTHRGLLFCLLFLFGQISMHLIEIQMCSEP